MKVTKEVLAKMGITPRLRLGERKEEWSEEKNKMVTVVVSTGPHKVKIIGETLKNDKDKETGKPCQVIEYALEEGGVKKKWIQPLYKKGEPNYLFERLSEIAEGEEFILEMRKKGIKNYVSIQRFGTQTDFEYGEDEDKDGLPSEDEIEKKLAEEAEKSAGPWDKENPTI